MQSRRFSVLVAMAAAVLLAGGPAAARAAISYTGNVEPDPSTWDNTTTGYVGNTANGTLTVNDVGGSYTLNSYIGCIGTSSGVTGYMTITGSGTSWINDWGVFNGLDGYGTLDITNGGNVQSGRYYLGYSNGLRGTMTVDAAGSQAYMSDSFYVGYRGEGILDISNGGAVTGEGCFYLAYYEDATGTATVDGADSRLDIASAYCSVGVHGDGVLNVDNAGVVNCDLMNVAELGTATGSATVNGDGSQLNVTTDLTIGYFGSGTLNVTDGGAVTNSRGYLARYTGSMGTATVEGAGSTWTNTTSLTLGSGTPTLNLNNGGALCTNTVVFTGAGEFNFDGGALKPYDASNPAWISMGAGGGVYVKEGGAVMDTAGYDMGIDMALRHGGAADDDGGLTKRGAGRLTLSGANTYTGRTVLEAGTLELAPAAHNAVLNLGGADVQAGKLVFDYAGGSTPAETIRGLLADSYDDDWNSGQFLCSTADSHHGLGWADDAVAEAVTIQRAFYGDANLDNTVNLSDLTILGQNWRGSGKVWAQGDFNYDGEVNLSDLTMLGQNWRASEVGMSFDEALSSVGMVVPEPGTLALLACGLAGLLVYAWRRRK